MKKLFFMAAIGLSLFAVASSSTPQFSAPVKDGYVASDTIPGEKRDTTKLPKPDTTRPLPPASLNGIR